MEYEAALYAISTARLKVPRHPFSFLRVQTEEAFRKARAISAFPAALTTFLAKPSARALTPAANAVEVSRVTKTPLGDPRPAIPE